MAWRGLARHGVAWRGAVQRGTAWYGAARSSAAMAGRGGRMPASRATCHEANSAASNQGFGRKINHFLDLRKL